MKLNLRFFLLLLPLISMLGSCESYFTGVNENSSAPTQVTEDVLLTGTQVELADLYGGETTRFAGMLTQQLSGQDRCGVYYYYTGLLPSEFSTMWENTYANVLNNAKILKEQANTKGLNHVEGVANVLLAFQLMQATDVWGDIPWSEALQGTGNLSPKFDEQEDIYNVVNLLIDDAITFFNDSDGGVGIGGDLIYNGVVEQWKKAAYALKARASIRWGDWYTERYTTALSAIQNSFTSNVDDMMMPYPGTGGNEAPMYRFLASREGHIEFDNNNLGQIMLNYNDTIRRAKLDLPFNTEHPYFTADYHQPLITYRELKFIEAECLIRTNGDATAIHNAYLEGIRASFEHLGVVDSYQDYVQQSSVDPGIGNITLQDIWREKYIGLFGLPEVYNEYRRTDYPALTPTRGTAIPVRFPYPEQEAIFNTNTPTNVQIMTERVRWDVQ